MIAVLVAAALHEARCIVRDSAALLVLVIAPFGYALLYPAPYARQLSRDVPVVAVDEDGGAAGRQLVRMIDATEQVSIIATVPQVRDAELLVMRGEAHGVVVVPSGFERSIRRGEQATVAVLGDATRFMHYSQVATGASYAVGTMSAGIEIRRHRAAGATEDVARHVRDPLPLAVHPLFNPSGAYGLAVIPGVFVLILQQTLLVGIGIIGGGRREDGTSGGHTATGFAAALELAGRGGVYALLYSGHAVLHYVVIFRLFGIPVQGSMATAIVFLLPFLLATAFLGIAVSGVFRDRETALPVLVTTSLPALFVSGFPWPAEALPAWLRAAAVVLPSTSAIEGAVRVTRIGAALDAVRTEWFVLWLLCGCYLAAALVVLGRSSPAAAVAVEPARGTGGGGPHHAVAAEPLAQRHT